MRANIWRIWRRLRHPRLESEIARISHKIETVNRLSLPSFREVQLQQLRQFLVYCQTWVPYYRRVFEETGVDPQLPLGWAEFTRLPVLTREIVRKDASELLSRDPSLRDIVQNHTGGSTGEPLSFSQDRNYHLHGLACERYFRQMWGLTNYGRTAYIWGCDNDINNLDRRERIWLWFEGTRFLNAFDMNQQRAMAFVQELESWQPEAIFGYVRALDFFARHVSPRSPMLRNLRLVRTSAEVLDASTRQRLETVFSVPVVDFYGSREVNNLAWECPSEHRLHIFSPFRIVESDGLALDQSQSRRLLVTDLANHSMPFVRYAPGDLGILDSAPCSDGIGSPTIRALRGRSADLILSMDGTWIHGEFFTHLFYGVPGIERFQIHQLETGDLQLILQGTSSLSRNSLPQILDRITTATGHKVQVRWISHFSIPPSGKHRFTTSELTQRILSDPEFHYRTQHPGPARGEN